MVHGLSNDMHEPNITNSAIRSFILQKFPAARRRAINDNTPLLESGIIDSLGVLEVIAYLERSFSIAVSDDELVPDNFANVDRITLFVQNKQGQNRSYLRVK